MEGINVANHKPKGPSLSALAALTTLAVTLWMQVDLPTAIFRSLVVYLVLSLISMTYRVILGRLLAASQAKAQRELLEKVQREAEEEEERKRKQMEEAAVRPSPNRKTSDRQETQVNGKQKQPEASEA